MSCIMFIMPFWYGVFYEYCAFAVGIVFLILLYKIARQKKQLVFVKSRNVYLYAVLIVSYLLVVIWAVDKEIAWEGFLKYLPGIFYFLLLMQFEKQEKQKIMEMIPLSGAIMCIISFVLGQIPQLHSMFFSENGRLISFFQYSNSFALFLLLGIVIIANNQKNTLKDKILALALIVGIILTGSRTTFILAVCYGIYQIFKHRKNKKQIGIVIGIILISVCMGILVLVITDNLDNVSRLLQVSFTESTFVGRILYALDGIKLITQNPFGLGYMGYSYKYPEIQTADYNIKLIHNDFLQQALDTGIISMIVLLYLFIQNIVTRKTKPIKREMLIIMLLHMLFEFDMQFLVLHFIWVMLLEDTEGRTIFLKVEKAKIVTAITTFIMITLFAYFGIATYAEKIGKYEMTLELLPNKTNASVQKMLQEQDEKEAEKLANTILKQNPYIGAAYKVKANNAYYAGNWEQMIEYQKKAITLNRYDITEYEEYILYISQALEQTIRQEKQEETKYLIKEAKQITAILENTKQTTHPLAYQIIDKPQLEFRGETKQYLEMLENYYKGE